MSAVRQAKIEEIAKELERLEEQADSAGLVRLAGLIRSIRLEAEKARRLSVN